MNELVIIGWFCSAAVGAVIGLQKGKPGKGALLGLFFGPVGWVLMMFDVGIAAVVVVTVAAAALLFAVVVNVEKDRDAAQRREIERREIMRDYQAEVSSGAALARLSRSSPSTPAPTATPALPNPGGMFPPGVDTPEQRREYLQALAESRKNAPPPVKRQPALRDRGY